jgi:hypothetical protein
MRAKIFRVKRNSVRTTHYPPPPTHTRARACTECKRGYVRVSHRGLTTEQPKDTTKCTPYYDQYVRKPGLWSRYTKALTPTPRILKLRFRLLHKSSICINNGKPVRHFITTT